MFWLEWFTIMMKFLLTGLMAASVFLAAPRAEAQFSTPPLAVVSDAYNVETNGPGIVFFAVALNKFSATPVVIRYATSDGTARAGSDYQASSGVVYFAPFQRVALIPVPIIGDTVEEPDEYFSVVLSDARGAVLFDGVGNAGISDNDYSGTISVADVALAEGNSSSTNFGFRITLSTPPLHTFTVGFRTVDGNALVGEDYLNTFGAVQFLPGQQSQIVNVPVVGDLIAEPNEAFALQLIVPGYNVVKPLGAGIIFNDDFSFSAQSRLAPSGAPQPSAGAS